MYPLHENETGSFQELAHSYDIKFGQLSILKIKQGCARGGHYHTRKEEWFCGIHGQCELKMQNIKDGAIRIAVLNDNIREFVSVHPFESHTITNLSKTQDCEVLIIISEAYDDKDPDTVKYEEKNKNV